MPELEEELTRVAYDAVADVCADRFMATEPEQCVALAMIDHFTRLLEPPRSVLDAGCGAGRMLPFLAARGCVPHGVDLSPQMIRRARRDHPEYPTSVGSLTALDLPDAGFDGVFSWYSIVHNPDEDLDRMVAEMTRVLRPGGHLLVAFQVGDGMRRVGQGFAAMGLDVVMNRCHRSTQDVTGRLRGQGLDVVALMERAPMAGEPDGQAVVIARRDTSHWSSRSSINVSGQDNSLGVLLSAPSWVAE